MLFDENDRSENRSLIYVVDELLRYTQMQIDEIARRCGYSSATSLSRYLAQHTGQSPTVRRRVLRKQGDLGKFGL